MNFACAPPIGGDTSEIHKLSCVGINFFFLFVAHADHIHMDDTRHPSA